MQRLEEMHTFTNFFFDRFGVRPEFLERPTNAVPDLAVRFDGKIIGVEATTLVHDNGLAAADSQSYQFLCQTKATFDSLGGFPGYFAVSFRSEAAIRRIDRETVGAMLAREVLEGTKGGDDEFIELEVFSPAVAQCVKSVRCVLTPHERGSFWTAPVATWVAGLSNAALQARISAKEAKLAEYRKAGFNEYWLLIYARVGKRAETFDNSTEYEPALLSSQFDRTFFYNYWRNDELGVAS